MSIWSLHLICTGCLVVPCWLVGDLPSDQDVEVAMTLLTMMVALCRQLA